MDNDNFASKDKRYSKKVIEKYYIEFLEDGELSQDVMRQLQNILAEATPYEVKSTTVSTDQQQQQGLLRLLLVLMSVVKSKKSIKILERSWHSEPI